MIGYILVWTIYLFATADAAPAAAEKTAAAADAPRTVTSLQARDISEHSVQITYGEDPSGHHLWSVWYGPQGVAVDPCKPAPFRRVQLSAAQIVKDSSIEKPPFPPKETWNKLPLTFQDTTCSIKGYGQEGAPTFQCGNTLIYDFERDVQFNDPIVKCDDGYKHHRGWTVEYWEPDVIQQRADDP
jgi:hypothetical protein